MRLLFLLAAACASKRGPSPAYYDSDQAYGRGGAVAEEYGVSSAKAQGGRFAAPMDAPAAPPPPPAVVAEQAPPAEPAPAPSEAQARMVHYDGLVGLRVANPPETLDAVVALAESVGGRTERLSGNVVTVRVPVERFEEVLAQVLALGDLVQKSIRADDVTEQYTAIDLRARTLRATQARLVELLARAEDEAEKLSLLQEITRVTEELDAIEVQLRTLSDLAAMSRITVEAMPREAFSDADQGPELAGFEWIRALSPFNRAPSADDKRVALPVPDGLVALSPRGPFAAESADGVVLWTLRVPNDPVGTADFWVDSVEDRLADEFADPVREAVGGWQCLSVHEPGADEPYTWQVCVADAGKWLHVAQAYFPGPAQVERYGAAVDAALEGGGDS